MIANSFNFDEEKMETVNIGAINICKIYPYINKVEGFMADSASPTDIWNVSFKKNVLFKNNSISNAFMKLYIDPDSLGYKSPELDGLNYEILIYRDLIKPLIDTHICSNFVLFINAGLRCSYYDLLNFLKGNLRKNGRILTDSECIDNLNRNIHIISKQLNKRPEIQNTTNLFKGEIDISKNQNYKFNMILNTNVSSSIKFNKWISDVFNNDINNNIEEFWNILFQICYACYCMSLSKMVHNDLHSGNVFIQDLKMKVELIYIINNEPVIIKTRYKAIVYDFDRGFSSRFGINNLNVGNNCIYGSQCNTYIENKDIIKIICYVHGNISNILKNEILNLLSGNTVSLKELQEVYNVPG